MHLIGTPERLRGRSGEESGFAMAAVILAVFVTSLVAVGAVAAVNGDVRLTSRDLDGKRAYEAAQAAIADYSFHLNKDNGYWARCTNVPTPNAVNQMGSTANKRPVPGGTGATYAVELLPATGKTACDTANPISSMIESSGQANGTFRIRATGYSGDVQRSVVASFKRASFLDYVYFTQLETLDPVAYGDQATIDYANANCTKTYDQGRPYSFSSACLVINFTSGDSINGPFHSNDGFVVCGQPTFGRNASDLIETSASGWYANSTQCTNNTPTFNGTFISGAPVLTPPPTNGQLKIVPGATKYTGQTKIELSGNNMTVTTSGGTSTVPIPTSGVVYVSNGTCSSAYDPFSVTYPSSSGCGNVFVHGSYSGKLTIAAENDIVIDGNLTRSGDGLLGLIANNFVRIQHPLTNNSTSANSCGSGNSNATGSLSNVRIDAAMLAINHSFIVDHYNCGASLGNLTVNGAISQKFRGTVGTSAPTGYLKDYNYDDRLRYITPPHFLDPVESAWHMQRQTLDP